MSPGTTTGGEGADAPGGAGLRIGPRTIPIPNSISPEARAALARPQPGAPPPPALDDKAGWRTYIAAMNAAWSPLLGEQAASLGGAIETVTLRGRTVYVAEPSETPPGNRDKAVMFVHGGGLVIMGGECCRHYAAIEAAASRCRVYAPDFGNPPDHPYPDGLDDCLAVYGALLETYPAGKLVVTGASGGGNLAAAMVLKARDEGLPMPAAVGLFSPEVDLTQSGDSFQTNREVDQVLVSTERNLSQMIALYAGGANLRQPYLSPIFADFQKGFPPTFLQSGTRDLFLSNAVRMHRALRRAGVRAELHLGEAMPHGPFGGAPEDAELRDEFVRFLAACADFAPL
jgi:monoterpene epsilon-lactone hydrolase